MKNPDPHQHPLDDPQFDSNSHTPVWYLSHPLAADDRFTFQQNMDHVKHMMRLCFDAGFRVIAPYHTICEVLDDNNPEHRRIGLETDCSVARALGRIILCGHKVSKGMQCELEAVIAQNNAWENLLPDHAMVRQYIIDVTGMSDDKIIVELENVRIVDG